MRFGRRIALSTVLAILVLGVSAEGASADFPNKPPTVGCQATAEAVEFGGECFGAQPPTPPTQPAADHPWLTAEPSTQPPCMPYETIVWAAPSGQPGDGVSGTLWALGQRLPILYSTPQTDFGWEFTVTCGDPGTIQYQTIVRAARTPSPCSTQTLLTACLPGYDPSGFLAAAEGHVPAETIVLDPTSTGVVGVPVEAQLSPVPSAAYAEVDVAAPDLGDGDPAEILHVVWVVQATPEVVLWRWPDGSTSASARWVPQTYTERGTVGASLVYEVTAAGYWSDGVSVHDLPSVTVGSIPLTAQLPYSVEQIQAGLG